jgi:hypothetical protein
VNHVSGIVNPADLASRGLKPSELIHNDLWWVGPEFIRKGNFSSEPSYNPGEELETIKGNPPIFIMSISKAEKNESVFNYDKYSKIAKHISVASIVAKFIKNIRSNIKKNRRALFFVKRTC